MDSDTPQHYLTQSQVINIAIYKHHRMQHSVSLDRATLMNDVDGCRLRVLGYKYAEFPLPDGMSGGVISSCFHIEYGFNSKGEVQVFFDTEKFEMFGQNFRIVKEDGKSTWDSSDLGIVLNNDLTYKPKYLPNETDSEIYIQLIQQYFDTIQLTDATVRKAWSDRNS